MSTARWVIIGCALASAGGYLTSPSSLHFQQLHLQRPIGRVAIVSLAVDDTYPGSTV